MREHDPRGASIAFAAFTCCAVGILLGAAVLTSSFSGTDKLLLLAVVVGLLGGTLAMLARRTP